MNERPEFDTAAEFERVHVRARAGRTLIVGSRVYKGREDRRMRYEDCLGVDIQSGFGVDLVIDMEGTPPASFGFFDHVECRSVLEHAQHPWLVAMRIESAMREDATLHLAVPFVWRQHSYPGDLWRFTTEAVRALFPRIVWSVLMYANQVLDVDMTRPAGKTTDGFPFFLRTEVLGFGIRK